jgi:heat shock protein HtpX
VPVPQVALLRSNLPNAFSAGRGPNLAVIVVTTALLETATGEELTAVLAHEVAHIRNRDMVAMSFAGVLPALFSGFAGMCRGEEPRDVGHIRSFLASGAQALAAVTSLPLWMLSRYREYAADRGAALLIGSPEIVAAAIVRISGEVEAIPHRDLRDLRPLGAFCFTAPERREPRTLSADAPPEERLAWRLASAFDGFVTGHPPVRARLAWLGRLQRVMAGV